MVGRKHNEVMLWFFRTQSKLNTSRYIPHGPIYYAQRNAPQFFRFSLQPHAWHQQPMLQKLRSMRMVYASIRFLFRGPIQASKFRAPRKAAGEIPLPGSCPFPTGRSVTFAARHPFIASMSGIKCEQPSGKSAHWQQFGDLNGHSGATVRMTAVANTPALGWLFPQTAPLIVPRLRST